MTPAYCTLCGSEDIRSARPGPEECQVVICRSCGACYSVHFEDCPVTRGTGAMEETQEGPDDDP